MTFSFKDGSRKLRVILRKKKPSSLIPVLENQYGYLAFFSKMESIETLSIIKTVSVKEYEIVPVFHRNFLLTFHFFLSFIHLKYFDFLI